jgi:hypothetical protein
VKTIENIKKVALVLFIILGMVHIIAGLMFSNGYLLPYSFIANRSLDIPFGMTAIIYAATHIYTKTGEKAQKIAGVGLVTVSLLIFVLLIYINLFITDKVPLDTL